MNRGARWLWVGTLVFVLLGILRAPASLLGLMLPADALRLTATEGTLWNGRGELWVQQTPTGSLAWQWLPSSLLGGRIGIAAACTGDGIDVAARLSLGLREQRVDSAEGQIDEVALLRLLQPYQLALGGVLRFDGVTVTRAGSHYRHATGNIRWSGGPLAYRLRGQRYQAELPPLQGQLALRATALTLAARAHAAAQPMLVLGLRGDGWFEAGASRAFIELAGQPWPGASAAGDIVLAVEEKLF